MNLTLKTRFFRHAGSTALAVVLTASQAAAQATAAPATVHSSEASAHFERGVAFYAEADYSAALVEFKRAYALAPAWQVLFNIGQSYFQVRDYAGALVTLGRFIDEGQNHISQERRALVEAERADLADRVGHASIVCNLRDATIRIDDAIVGVTPLPEPVLVSVGVRKIVATRPGLEPVEQLVSIPVGETVEVRFDLYDPSSPQTGSSQVASTQAASPEAAAPPIGFDRVAPRPAHSHAAAGVALGVAAAGVAAGAVFGALALHDKSRLASECSGRACTFGSQSDIDAASRDGTISTIAFGAAAVGTVAGLVLWLAAGGGRGHETPSAASHGPIVSFGSAPGSIAGSF